MFAVFSFRLSLLPGTAVQLLHVLLRVLFLDRCKGSRNPERVNYEALTVEMLLMIPTLQVVGLVLGGSHLLVHSLNL